MNQPNRAIGLMSGTSMDGIDVALVETDGEALTRCGDGLTCPYPADTRALISGAVEEAQKNDGASRRTGCMAEAEEAITRAHAEAVRQFMEREKIAVRDIDVVGFHGQTILHRPGKGYTVQLGDGQLLADLTGAEVVYDFRSRDMMSGGQGAPLAPVYHRALARQSRFKFPLAVVNIGGVANVTWIGGDDELLAFDTGPGNALIDDWVNRHSEGDMDVDGRIASRGKVNETTIEAFFANGYFDKKPPKSLDRNDFSTFLVEGLGFVDATATLTAITAEGIARSVEHMPKAPLQWVVCGGGARNPALMDMLRNRLKGRMDTARDVGWSDEFMEAEAFGYMAVRSRRQLPITFPGTTGVASPVCGGVCVSPAKS